MTRLTWLTFVMLSLTPQYVKVVLGARIPELKSSLEEQFGPDAAIEAFMRDQNQRYQSNLEPLAKGLHYYYNNYDDIPPVLDSQGYINPAHYASEDLLQSNADHPVAEPQPKEQQTSQSKSEPEQKLKPDDHIKLKEKPKPAEVEQEISKIKLVSRSGSGSGHVGANEVMAVAPGLAEALKQDEEYSKAASHESSIADVYLLAVIAGCAVAAVSGLALTGVCWYRLHKKVKAASDVEYPAYGVTGPAKEKSGPPGDRKLAQSAQMYHYQHQKQQMIASERMGSDQPGGNGGGGSEGESEDECEEGDYTVFECPGLATAGEMEVRNPLFNDQTPVATPAEK